MATARCGFNDEKGLIGADALVLYGPTLIVDIGFDPNYEPAARPVKHPSLESKGLYALVDTGATLSYIDSGLAINLNLPIVDRQTVGGISGAREVNMHLGQIHVPALEFTVYGSFGGVDLIAGDSEWDIVAVMAAPTSTTISHSESPAMAGEARGPVPAREIFPG